MFQKFSSNKFKVRRNDFGKTTRENAGIPVGLSVALNLAAKKTNFALQLARRVHFMSVCDEQLAWPALLLEARSVSSVRGRLKPASHLRVKTGH